MADRQYKAHLIQHEWVTTEIFDISANDEKSAKAEAEKLIETKDLKDKEYKLEVVEADAPAPEVVDGAVVAEEPGEPEVR